MDIFSWKRRLRTETILLNTLFCVYANIIVYKKTGKEGLCQNMEKLFYTSIITFLKKNIMTTHTYILIRCYCQSEHGFTVTASIMWGDFRLWFPQKSLLKGTRCSFRLTLPWSYRAVKLSSSIRPEPRCSRTNTDCFYTDPWWWS